MLHKNNSWVQRASWQVVRGGWRQTKIRIPTIYHQMDKIHTVQSWSGKFTVHSGRAAASSCALLLGMPIDSILRHVGWRSKHTFATRYMKMPSTTIEDRYGFSKN